MPAKPVVNFMLSQNERKEAAKRGMKLCSSSLVLEMRLGREWVKQGRKSGTSGSLYTRAFCWPRGTICQYAHCVALLTPIRRGGVRTGVWLLLDDEFTERVRGWRVDSAT